MFRKNILFFSMMFSIWQASAQYGFEWIRSYQPYYTFKITTRGVYKIDSATLAISGISLTGVHPKRFQLFRNGVEQAVWIAGQQDGVMNASDYIEFFADKNDGKLDAEMYTFSTDQPHTYNSLITDTAVYFLTLLPDTSAQQGLRMTSVFDNNYGSYIPETHFMHEVIYAPIEDYADGINLAPGQKKYNSSEYTDDEGWGSSMIGLGGNRQVTLRTPFQSNQSNQIAVELKVFGRSDATPISVYNHHLKYSFAPAENGIFTNFHDTKFTGYVSDFYSSGGFTLNRSMLGASNTIFKFESVNDLGVLSDFTSLSYLRLTYPRQYELGGDSALYFKILRTQPGTKSYISMNGYGNGNTQSPVIYDFDIQARIIGSVSGTTARLILPSDGFAHQLYLFDSAHVTMINSLKQVALSPINPAQNYTYLIITHPSLEAAASNYATYRSAKYTVLKVYAQDLYNLYTYGNVHPLAVRRFAKHLLNVQTTKPQFMLLAGRGYQTDLLRKTTENFNNNLVPSMGVPSSDVMFSSGIKGSGYEADIPTGRIPAANNDELNNYLQKIIYYETNPDSVQEWRRNLLHISGGDGSGEQLLFKSFLLNNKQVAMQPSWGANVYTYNKSTTDPTQTDLRQLLIDKVNNGVSMLTFLGHASATILDVDIGTIHDLSNVNKYVFYYFNGCNVGNANIEDPKGAGNIYAKDYICTASKGAVGWLSHTNETWSGNLDNQMRAFYLRKANTMYGQPIGNIMKQTSASLSGSTDVKDKSHALQWLLQGDPAMVVYSPQIPDWKVEKKDVFLDPVNVNSLTDSFDVAFVITSQGRCTNDSLDIQLVRTLPNQQKVTFPLMRIHPIYYRDTIRFTIRSKDPLTVGQNSFEVTIDPLNKLSESNKTNNTASIDYFIPGSGIQMLYPQPYAIVANDTIIFTVQNNNLFAQNAGYYFEVDTVDLTKDAPTAMFKSSGLVTASALCQWKVTIQPQQDTQVFFWRARLNLPANQGGDWNKSSFTFIRNGNRGWAQSKLDQYTDFSSSEYLLFNRQANRMEFVENGSQVQIINKRWSHPGTGVTIPYFSMPSAFVCGVSEPVGGTLAMLFDSSSLVPISAARYPYNCNPASNIFYYAFQTSTPAGEAEFGRFLDSIDNNTYVAIVSRYNGGQANWSQSTRDKLANLGSIKAANARSFYTAYALIGQKGAAPGTAVEDTVFNNVYNSRNDLDSQFIQIDRLLKGKWYTGSIISKPIGPVRNWGKMFYSFRSQENVSTDTVSVDIIVTNKQGIDSMFLTNVGTGGIDISMIDAIQYPYIKLKATFTDQTRRTPAQFGNWMVTYDPIPEGAIILDEDYAFYSPTLQQGDSILLRLKFKNIAYDIMDSLPVRLTITDLASRTDRYTYAYTYPALKPDSFVVFYKKLSSTNLSGRNQLVLGFNPDRAIPEVSFVNNFFNKNIDVSVDSQNPLMDVTFDGYRIMNGDFVSPNPVIQVTSSDENKYRIQNDTSTFSLALKRPGSTSFERVTLSSSQVQFIPGTAKNNKAAVIYTPQALPNGQYTLQVQARDASGNISGANAYSIDFVVENASTITNFFPYPNPCTTNMRFVFTLTGSKPPDQMLIKIYTLSGKLVKEVTKEEFGNIKIGNNISEWSWDGTDMFGDRLANGVYLYQVQTVINGEGITKRNTKADKFVTYNTGKIYLMR